LGVQVGTTLTEFAERLLARRTVLVGIKTDIISLACLRSMIPAVLSLRCLVYQIDGFFIFRAWA